MGKRFNCRSCGTHYGHKIVEQIRDMSPLGLGESIMGYTLCSVCGDTNKFELTWADSFQNKAEPKQMSFEDYVIEDGHYEAKARELGKMVDDKQKAYGNSMKTSVVVMQAFMEKYRQGDNYVFPMELLEHMLIQVRIIDKQCRIFSNPQGDLMGESPYKDIMGYGLLASSRFSKEGK